MKYPLYGCIALYLLAEFTVCVCEVYFWRLLHALLGHGGEHKLKKIGGPAAVKGCCERSYPEKFTTRSWESLPIIAQTLSKTWTRQRKTDPINHLVAGLPKWHPPFAFLPILPNIYLPPDGDCQKETHTKSTVFWCWWFNCKQLLEGCYPRVCILVCYRVSCNTVCSCKTTNPFPSDPNASKLHSTTVNPW